MTAPLEEVIVIPRQDLDSERLPTIATTAAERAGADRPVHLTRYPAFGRRLRAADIGAESIPDIGREIVEHTDRDLIPSAVDRELRLAILREQDWEGTGPRMIAEAATADKEALHHLACRILGMAAWQDLDLSAAGEPIRHFGSLQTRHEALLDALGWTPPERVLPHARDAISRNPELLDLVFGPSTDGIIVWECEELIDMGLEFVAALNETKSTVGIYIENGAMRRPYAQSDDLLRGLDGRGVEWIHYDDLDFASSAARSKARRSQSEHLTEQVTWFEVKDQE